MQMWKDLATLNVARGQHVCGVATLGDTPFLVVAGGYNNDYDALNSAEKLDLSNMGKGWKIGTARLSKKKPAYWTNFSFCVRRQGPDAANKDL